MYSLSSVVIYRGTSRLTTQILLQQGLIMTSDSEGLANFYRKFDQAHVTFQPLQCTVNQVETVVSVSQHVHCSLLIKMATVYLSALTYFSPVYFLPRAATGVWKIIDYHFFSLYYRLIINFLILYRLILTTFLFSGYLAMK